MTRLWLTMVAVLAVGCGDNKVPQSIDAPMPDTGRSQVDRGRYIMNNLGVCTFCHTPLNPDGSRDLTRLFAGVECLFDFVPDNFPNPGDGVGIGCVNSRNLTNDPTGLMFATDEQIKDAFRNGNRTDGKKLSPVMPWWAFHNMSDDDADSIVAYLRTVPGVTHQVPPNEEPIIEFNEGNIPMPPYLDKAKITMPDPLAPNQDSALRGRYLVSMVGLCVDCHTPTINPDPTVIADAFTLDQDRFFVGGRQFPAEALGLPVPPYPPLINTRNLTRDATGLMDFSTDDIKNAISKGKDKMGNAVCAATHGSTTSPYAALDPSDLDDIANYVFSLPAVVNDTSPNCAGPPVP
jgi:mono/diheme cytochrome c family protein